MCYFSWLGGYQCPSLTPPCLRRYCKQRQVTITQDCLWLVRHCCNRWFDEFIVRLLYLPYNTPKESLEMTEWESKHDNWWLKCFLWPNAMWIPSALNWELSVGSGCDNCSLLYYILHWMVMAAIKGHNLVLTRLMKLCMRGLLNFCSCVSISIIIVTNISYNNSYSSHRDWFRRGLSLRSGIEFKKFGLTRLCFIQNRKYKSFGLLHMPLITQ